MKGHWIKYLGLLGFLGLLGPLTSNPGMAGFFGFFGFFGWGGIISDERLEANVNKAARNAFVCSLVVYVLATILSAVLPGRSLVLAYAFAVSFALQILVFALSFRYYDRG